MLQAHPFTALGPLALVGQNSQHVPVIRIVKGRGAPISTNQEKPCCLLPAPCWDCRVPSLKLHQVPCIQRKSHIRLTQEGSKAQLLVGSEWCLQEQVLALLHPAGESHFIKK